MPVALDLGGTPVNLGELQSAVEDYTISQSAEFDVEHDHQGRHTKPFTDAFTVTGQASLLGGSILGALLAFDDEFAQTLTATTHDLKKPDGSAIPEVQIRLQAASTFSLTGIVPYDATRGQVHLIENGGAATIRLEHDHASSTYPFSLPGELDLDLESGGVVLLKWDIHSSIWRCVQAGSPMATVQRSTITFTNGGANTVDATISAVDFDSAEVRYLGARGDAAFFCLVRLLDDSHVRAERDNAFNSVNAVASFEVSGRLL